MVGIMLFFISIPAGPAPETMIEFSRQTHTQILFDYTTLSGELTAALPPGQYYPSRALDLMLRSTNLRYDWINSTTLTIIPGPISICKPWLGADAPLPPCTQRKNAL